MKKKDEEDVKKEGEDEEKENRGATGAPPVSVGSESRPDCSLSIQERPAAILRELELLDEEERMQGQLV